MLNVLIYCFKVTEFASMLKLVSIGLSTSVLVPLMTCISECMKVDVGGTVTRPATVLS